jgi:hypothetical protein
MLCVLKIVKEIRVKSTIKNIKGNEQQNAGKKKEQREQMK